MSETLTQTPPSQEVIDEQARQAEAEVLRTHEQTTGLQAHAGSLLLEQMVDTPEAEEAPEKTTFVDGRGVERGPNPLAAEVILTPEIEEVVDKHFEGVYAALPEIDERLDQLETQISVSGETSLEDRPEAMDEQFMSHVKEKLKAGIDMSWDKDNPSQIVTRGELTDGEKAKLEQLEMTESGAEAKEKLQQLANDLLFGSAGNIDNEPILVKRILESGRDVEDLDMDTLIELVPEMSPIMDSVTTVEKQLQEDKNAHESKQAIQKKQESQTKIDILEKELQDLLPFGYPNNELLSTIYYSETDLAEVGQRLDRLKALQAIIDPGRAERGTKTEDILKMTHKSIEGFFTKAVRADELMFHSTPSAPRIVQDGFLRPPASMDDSEFMSSTRTDNVEISGSNALHFAGSEKIVYSANDEGLPHRMGIGNTDIIVEEERAKGHLGKAVFGVRMGDIIEASPHGGVRNQSHGGAENTDKFTTIRLTESGYVKVADQLASKEHVDDIFYTSAPGGATLEEAYDHRIPVEDTMIAIASRSEDAVKEALRQAGWSEEAIADHTATFTTIEARGSDVPVELQRRAYEEGKYANQVVVKLSR